MEPHGLLLSKRPTSSPLRDTAMTPGGPTTSTSITNRSQFASRRNGTITMEPEGTKVDSFDINDDDFNWIMQEEESAALPLLCLDDKEGLDQHVHVFRGCVKNYPHSCRGRIITEGPLLGAYRCGAFKSELTWGNGPLRRCEIALLKAADGRKLRGDSMVLPSPEELWYFEQEQRVDAVWGWIVLLCVAVRIAQSWSSSWFDSTLPQDHIATVLGWDAAKILEERQWHRMLTCFFVHDSWQELVFGLFGLVAVAKISVESRMGSRKTLALTTLCLFGTSVFHLTVMPSTLHINGGGLVIAWVLLGMRYADVIVNLDMLNEADRLSGVDIPIGSWRSTSGGVSNCKLWNLLKTIIFTHMVFTFKVALFVLHWCTVNSYFWPPFCGTSCRLDRCCEFYCASWETLIVLPWTGCLSGVCWALPFMLHMKSSYVAMDLPCEEYRQQLKLSRIISASATAVLFFSFCGMISMASG